MAWTRARTSRRSCWSLSKANWIFTSAACVIFLRIGSLSFSPSPSLELDGPICCPLRAEVMPEYNNKCNQAYHMVREKNVLPDGKVMERNLSQNAFSIINFNFFSQKPFLFSYVRKCNLMRRRIAVPQYGQGSNPRGDIPIHCGCTCVNKKTSKKGPFLSHTVYLMHAYMLWVYFLRSYTCERGNLLYLKVFSSGAWLWSK